MSILWLGRSRVLIIAGLLLRPLMGDGKDISFSVLGPIGAKSFYQGFVIKTAVFHRTE